VGIGSGVAGAAQTLIGLAGSTRIEDVHQQDGDQYERDHCTADLERLAGPVAPAAWPAGASTRVDSGQDGLADMGAAADAREAGDAGQAGLQVALEGAAAGAGREVGA
jgi:hypothetical protein